MNADGMPLDYQYISVPSEQMDNTMHDPDSSFNYKVAAAQVLEPHLIMFSVAVPAATLNYSTRCINATSTAYLTIYDNANSLFRAPATSEMSPQACL